MKSFETEMPAEEKNFAGLARTDRERIGKAEAAAPVDRMVLDTDSTGIPVYGQQEQSADNGHFQSTCYQPLLLFNRERDCAAAKLRPGNVPSAEGWEERLLPEIERQQKQGQQVVFRARLRGRPGLCQAGALRGFRKAEPKVFIRLPANNCLDRDIAGLLTRQPGRPS